MKIRVLCKSVVSGVQQNTQSENVLRLPGTIVKLPKAVVRLSEVDLRLRTVVLSWVAF